MMWFVAWGVLSVSAVPVTFAIWRRVPTEHHATRFATGFGFMVAMSVSFSFFVLSLDEVSGATLAGIIFVLALTAVSVVLSLRGVLSGSTGLDPAAADRSQPV